MSQSIRSNFLHLSALDSEPGSELQFETHQSNRVPRMFLVSFRVSFLNLAPASCMFLIPLVSVVNLAPNSRLHRCSMNLVWIVNRFSMILESFGGPEFHDFAVQTRLKIGLGKPLGAKADFEGPKAFGDIRFGRPSWGIFGPKSASCGVLEPQEAS